MRSVNDELRAIEMTHDIEGTQLYANSTTLDTDGGVYEPSSGDFGSRTTTSV